MLSTMVTAHLPEASTGGHYAVLMKGKEIVTCDIPEEISREVKCKFLQTWQTRDQCFVFK